MEDYYERKQRRTLEMMRLLFKWAVYAALAALLIALFACSTVQPKKAAPAAPAPCQDTLIDRATGELILIGC